LLFHYKDARVHCAVLKKRAGPGHRPLRDRISWSASKALLVATDPSGPNSVLGYRSWPRGSTPPASRRLY
jgi:hypothetical protein